MPRLIGGPEKAHDADVTIAAHAICVRTTMLSLHLIENFLRFQVQDKHNASSNSNMFWKEFPQSGTKVVKFHETGPYIP